MSTICFILVTLWWNFFYSSFHVGHSHYVQSSHGEGWLWQCGLSMFFLNEVECLPWVPGGRGVSSWSSEGDGGTESPFWTAGTFGSVTTSFTTMSLFLFWSGKYHHWKKKKVNNLGTEFCIFWYCHERILCIWQAFVLSRRNSFFSPPPEQDANLKGKEHGQEILAIWEKRQRPSALPLQET